MKNIILDLCGGTGAWSLPYKEAGFDVYNITLPDYDVRKVSFKDGRYIEFFSQHPFRLNVVVEVAEIYGILSAPPCTMFSIARTVAKKPRDFDEGMETVRACLDIIWRVRAKQRISFWALENPLGFLRQFLGKPPFTFQPWEFGEHYSKKTDIWGYFNEPIRKYKNPKEIMTEGEIALCRTNSRKLPFRPFEQWGKHLNHKKQSALRAITPKGFAQAFYKANSKKLDSLKVKERSKE